MDEVKQGGGEKGKGKMASGVELEPTTKGLTTKLHNKKVSDKFSDA